MQKLSILLIALILAACASSKGGMSSDEVTSIEMPLTAVSSDGVLHRLEGTFKVNGETIDSTGDTLFIPSTGVDMTIKLLDDWQMYEVEEGGEDTPVASILTSPNPVTVGANQTVYLPFNFDVAGATVGFDPGASISIGINPGDEVSSGGASGGGGSPPPSCFDGVQNSDEEGIDCGGVFAQCAPCGAIPPF